MRAHAMTVRLIRDGLLWCLWTTDGLYLCGYLCRPAAVEKARVEGWEIVT